MQSQIYFVLCLAYHKTSDPQNQVLSSYAKHSFRFIDYSGDFDPDLMMKFTDYGQALDFVNFAWSINQTLLVIASWDSRNPKVINCPYAKTGSLIINS